jgi:hypothetical protein
VEARIICTHALRSAVWQNNDVSQVPLWLGALIFAGAAPWFVRAIASGLEKRTRRRTLATLSSVRDQLASSSHVAGTDRAS